MSTSEQEPEENFDGDRASSQPSTREPLTLKTDAILGLVSGNQEPLIKLMHDHPDLMDDKITKYVRDALVHDQNAQYHFVLKKNPRFNGKGKSWAGAAAKQRSERKLAMHLIHNRAYAPGNRTAAVSKTIEETSLGRSKLEEVWSSHKDCPSLQYFIEGHRDGDQEIIQYVETVALKIPSKTI